MRNTFPLVEIVFFLAVSFAPKEASDIQVSEPGFSEHWIRNSKGWYSTDGKATWSTTDKDLAAALSRAIPEELEAHVDVSKPS